MFCSSSNRFLTNCFEGIDRDEFRTGPISVSPAFGCAEKDCSILPTSGGYDHAARWVAGRATGRRSRICSKDLFANDPIGGSSSLERDDRASPCSAAGLLERQRFQEHRLL